MDISSKIRGSDAYVKAALFGLGIFLSAALIIFVAILVVSPSDFAFGLILVIATTIAVALLLYVRRWGLAVVALLSAFGMLAFSPDAGLYLSTPEAFFDFLLALFTFTGLGIALIACVAGSVQYFRGSVGSQVGTSILLGLRGIAAAVAIAAAVSVVLTVVNATKSVSAQDREGAIVLTAHDTSWSAQTLDAPAGQPVRLLLKNDDPTLHTFTLRDSGRGLDIDVHLGPWSEQILDLGSLEPGTYGFICRIEGHTADMTGALLVK